MRKSRRIVPNLTEAESSSSPRSEIAALDPLGGSVPVKQVEDPVGLAGVHADPVVGDGQDVVGGVEDPARRFGCHRRDPERGSSRTKRLCGPELP